MPNAVPNGAGTENLVPLGEAGNTARLRLEAGETLREAQGSAAVNSLGLLDLVQITGEGLEPKTQDKVYLAESNKDPFREARELAVLKTNPDGAGTVQAIGPLKKLSANDPSPVSRRFLIVAEANDSSLVVLRQTEAKGDQP